ncbi:hypothetical protein ACTXT7_005822 [Hymenolepis weldensis]
MEINQFAQLFQARRSDSLDIVTVAHVRPRKSKGITNLVAESIEENQARSIFLYLWKMRIHIQRKPMGTVDKDNRESTFLQLQLFRNA